MLGRPRKADQCFAAAVSTLAAGERILNQLFGKTRVKVASQSLGLNLGLDGEANAGSENDARRGACFSTSDLYDLQ